MSIHPTAVIDPAAELGHDVTVHPFCVIEAGVEVGDGCDIGPHAVIRTGTRVGRGVRLSVGAVLGEDPQDRKFKGEETYLMVGENTHIREYVTLHRASGEGNATVIGDDCLIMAYSHVGHNAVIGNHVMMANCVQIAGHAVIDEHTVLGGFAGAHQFARIGAICMVGACSVVRIDVPPYMLVDGNPARPRKLNTVGLKRRGMNEETIGVLKQAFKLLYRSDLNTSDALKRITDEVEMLPEVANLVEFLEKVPEGERGRQLD